MKLRLFAATCILSIGLATAGQAATRPPIRVVSRPFSLAHGDPLTIVVYDRPPQLLDICTSVVFASHIKTGGCTGRSQVTTSGWGPEVSGENNRLWVCGLGPRGTTVAIVHVKGVRFVLHERGPWRVWLVPHSFAGALFGTDVSISYR